MKETRAFAPVSKEGSLEYETGDLLLSRGLRGLIECENKGEPLFQRVWVENEKQGQALF